MIEKKLAAATGREVRLGSAELEIFPPGVRVNGLALSGPGGTFDPPMLEIDTASGTFRPLWLLRGSVAIDAVDVDGVRLDWRSGGNEARAEPKASGPSLIRHIILRRVTVRNGRISYHGTTTPFGVEIENLRAAGESIPCSQKLCLSGAATSGKFGLHYRDYVLAGDALSASCTWQDGVLTVERFSVAAAEARAEGHAALHFAAPRSGLVAARLTASGRAARGILGSLPVEAGSLDVTATVTFHDGDAAVTGHGVVRNPAYPGIARAERAEGTFSYRDGVLQVDAEAEGTRPEIEGLVPDRGGPLSARISSGPDGAGRAELNVGPLPYPDLLSRLDPRLPVADTEAAGEGTLSWDRGRQGSLAGSFHVSLLPSGAAGPARGRPELRLQGDAELRISQDAVEIRDGHLESAEFSAGLSGIIEPGRKRSSLEVSMERLELQPALTALRDLPATAPAIEQSLRGTATGRLEATFGAGGVRAGGSFSSDEIWLTAGADEIGPFGAGLDWSLDGKTLAVSRLDLRGEGWSGAGTLLLDTSREWPLRSASVSTNGIPAAVIWSALGATLVEGGVVTGTGSFDFDAGDARRPAGTIELDVDGATLAGIPSSRMHIGALAGSGVFDIQDAWAETEAGRLEARGSYSPDDRLGRIEIASVSVALDELARVLAPGLGELTGSARVSGTLDLSPEGAAFSGSAAGEEVAWRGLRIGELEAPGIRYGPAEGLNVELRSPFASLGGSIAMPAGGEAAQLHFAFRDLELASLVPLMPPGSLPGLDGAATGTLDGTVPAADPDAARIDIALSSFAIHSSGLELEAAGTVHLGYRDGALRMEQSRFVGEGTDLTLSGVYDLGAGATGAAVLKGRFDARLIGMQFPEVNAQGSADIDLTLTAAGEAISYNGRLESHGARIDYPGSPTPAENLDLAAELDSTGRFQITQLAFDFAGGHVTGEGEGTLHGAHLERAEIKFRGTDLHTEPIPDLTIFFDGRARFVVEEDRASLHGQLGVVRATYTRELGLEGTPQINRARSRPSETLSGGGPGLLLDLDIVAPEEVWVRNKTARLEGSARLKVTGTLDRPELTGRITVFEDGTFKFRDVTYRSQGGGIDFDDPDVIDPLLDLRASTLVREYQINLHVLGRFSKPRFELSSEPALAPRDIVSLLVTGETYENNLALEAGATLIAEENVGQYLTAPISATLDKTVGKALKLTSVQLQPQFVNGRADPAARLTLTKRISPQLLFTYSNNLGSSEEQIYLFEYDLSRSWQLVGQRDFDASVSGSVIFRHRWGGPERRRPSRASPDGGIKGAPIEEILINDSPFGETGSLRKALGLREGRDYVRADALEGRERLREHLSSKGYPLAAVKLDESPMETADGTAVKLVYDLDPGTPVTLEIEGMRRREAAMKAVRASWDQYMRPADLAPAGEAALRSYLGDRGRAAAEIESKTKIGEGRARITYTVDAGPKVSVSSLAFEGAGGVPEEELRGAMVTREDRWNTSGTLRPEVLQADLQAVRAVYLSHGYLDARIEPPEVSFSEDREKANVTIQVHEGDVWRVGEVGFEGLKGAYPESGLREAALLPPGTVLRPSRIESAEERLRDLLDASGYNTSRVRHRLEGPPDSARVTFVVEEGPRQILAGVEIHGLGLTARRIVQREIELEPGDPISRAAMLDIQRRLYSLGIFRSVDVRTKPVEEGSPESRLIVQVEEGDPFQTSVGVGYDTEEHLQGFVQIGHNNAFGTGRSVSLLLRGSGLNRRAQLSLADRHLFGIPFEGIATVFWEEQERESFDVRRTGGGFQFHRKLSDQLTALGRYNIQDLSLLSVDPNFSPSTDLGEEDLRLANVGASLARDTRDDILAPASGTFSTADLALYLPGLGSQRTFSRLFLSGAAFHPVGRKVVFGAALRMGVEHPFGSTSEVPLAERLFSGGDTTLRGFKVDQAGPLDPASLKPIGGEVTLLANLELRFPIYRALKGVVFYDGGNTFLTPGDFAAGGSKLVFNRVSPGDCPFDATATNCPVAIQDGIRHVLGAGIRFDTPLGPIRLEYGRKLDRKTGLFSFSDGAGGRIDIERDESAYELFLSVGQAF